MPGQRRVPPPVVRERAAAAARGVSTTIEVDGEAWARTVYRPGRITRRKSVLAERIVSPDGMKVIETYRRVN